VNSSWQQATDFGIDVTLLEANLARTPAQRLQELVAMNQLQQQLQARTLTPAQRAAIDAEELRQKFGSLLDGAP
jgi:hypothetical protein